MLLISEDLDELLALCNCIVVISEGRVVFEVSATEGDRKVLAAHMGGGTHPSTAQQQERAAA